ncbi:short-chain dehydrogenase/reductase SDR [Acidisarcina polymorpha]|uniref:Short-chain dehydrogenase/reductase SDR n=1 Tax=Acidisarcina polymorpha TaxID=2211140 RepID=A0A2Z5FV10_9BACT|nr:SDR family oxidoreductase [Acidisarcina polymorpha]AXC10701.1 short-chain dehydrogenase/reductase SDR [Acidisarcina polymorpha]
MTSSAQGSSILRKRWQGKWGLVTGASAGIGMALAEELAAAGVNLVLTARRQDRLQALAAKLATAFGIQTKVLVADLEQADAPEQIFAATEGAGQSIDVLINNAGFGYYGEFSKGDPARQTAMVQVNCSAVVALTNLFLPRMIARKRGDIMIVASTAAYQPVPYLATYAATKVFDRFLAEALAQEVRPFGVHVSALCPGPTESEFGQVAGSPADQFRGSQKASSVARKGLEGLALGRQWVIPYFVGQAGVFVQRFLPRRMVTAGVAKAFRPKN